MFPEVENERYLAELLDLIKKNTVIPFVGAGMSSPAYPTWNKYLNGILDPSDKKGAEELGKYMDGANFDYEMAAQYLSKRCGIAFYDRTREVFSIDKLSPDTVNEAAFAIPQLFEGPVITTNLDQSLEWVYRSLNIPLPVGLANETGFINERMTLSSPCLWKIHGDVDKSDTWVLTKDQYDRLYSSSSFLQLFSSFLQYKVLLFLGSSLRSDKIVDLLEGLFQRNHHIRHYAVLPLPEEEIYYDELSRLRGLGINPIWYPAKDYDAFKDLIYEMAAKAGKRYVQSYFSDTRFQQNPPYYIKKKMS